MLEGDDEPKRDSGETDQEQSVTEVQTNSPEETTVKEHEEEEEEKDQQECEKIEIDQKQDKEREKEDETDKEKPPETKDKDDQQIVEGETGVEEQQKEEKIVEGEEEKLPQVKSDEDKVLQVKSDEENLPKVKSDDEEKLPQVKSDDEKILQVKSDEEKLPQAKSDEETLPQIKSDENPPPVKSDEEKLPQAKSDEEKLPQVKSDEEKLPQVKSDEEKLPQAKSDEEKLPQAKSDEEKLSQVKSDEEEKLPPVKIDEVDTKQEDKEEDAMKEDITEETKKSLDSGQEYQIEVPINKESSQEGDITDITGQETPVISQDNLTESTVLEEVNMAEQTMEKEGQEIESVDHLDQDLEGFDEPLEIVVEEANSSKEESMIVESVNEDKEEKGVECEKTNSTPDEGKIMGGTDTPSDKSKDVIDEVKETTDADDKKDEMQTDQEVEDTSKPEGEAAQERREKEDVGVETNDVQQNETSNLKDDITTTGKDSPSPDQDVDSDVDIDVEGLDHVEKKSNLKEAEEEDSKVEEDHEESNYDELDESDESLELKICIEGITELEEAVDAENRDIEEAMEVEEGGNEEDIEGDEVNGLGIIEDDEYINDEEYTPEDATNGSLSDEKTLPECRLKRNYCCVHCGINTQNPRQYLYHLRDDHGEKMKVFECPRCIYASKNHQKLIRHARMVHKMKIKKLQASSSKSPSKITGSNAALNKLARASVSPGKSSRSSPGKSPRSDDWDEMEDEEDQDFDQDGSPIKGEDKKFHYCEHCDYSCRSRKLLNRHETSYHLKRRFFRCVKCNYVTHLKGRYTKHLKYHQLPILKCDYCDFRTPYRWNLDRHLKNHTEPCGEFKCHLCNFTAQIKQSLTVHISNHHLTTEQIRERERRRTIGISDPADFAFDDQEMELMRLERDEHPDALMLPGYDAPDSPSHSENSHGQHNGNNSFRVSNIDVSGQDDSQVNADDAKGEDGESKRKKPKIKITLKKMKVSKPKDTFFQELNERHNFEEDFIHPDDVVHRHGNVYIKTFKCRFCTFKAAFKNEVARHEKKIHSIPMPKYMNQSRKARKTIKSSKVITTTNDVLADILKFPQTEDKDIAETVLAADNIDKLKEVEESLSEDKDDESSSKDKDDVEFENITEDQEDSLDTMDDQLSDSKDSSPSKDPSKKKNMSFFEKLQEKMPTSNVQNLVCQFCGHESKCLSESVRHQKLHLSAKNIYASTSQSTRCQFCRHRCKTTDDLMSHLKQCPEARKNQITDSGRRASGGRLDENEDSQCSSEKGENAECNENEDDMKDIAGKTPVLLDESMMKKEVLNHPMENRVFVWNKFDKTEEQNAQDKAKSSVEGKKTEKGSRRSSTDSRRRKNSGSKSPLEMEGSLDYYIESPTPQGHHYYSKRVYRCPQCSFWATTASRFHVHIVGHFNRKPYNCSECGYKSNWRWDITKHIKLKTSRDSSHQNAQVLITDETGEKNYEKYDCYVAIIQLDETNAHRTEGGIPNRKGRPKRTSDKDDVLDTGTPTASPIRKPPMVAIPVMPRLQSMPRLTRAPARSSASRPGPMPFGPILPGAQLMVQIAGSRAASSGSGPRPPPPLALKGAMKSGASTSPSTSVKTTASGNTAVTNLVTGGQYQIITPQVRTSCVTVGSVCE